MPNERKLGHYMRYGKRFLDFIMSASLLLLLSPLLGAIAVFLFLSSAEPVFFSQARPGLNGKHFRLYKFRTLKSPAALETSLLPQAQQLTPFGTLLRRTHLDELPQLVNVVRGDMSLVGPRPLLTEYLDLYTPEQNRRHEALPGMTGWAQVHGGNQLSWEDKFRLDVWYVDHISLGLDLKIMLMTLQAILRPPAGRGTDFPATMFTGVDKDV